MSRKTKYFPSPYINTSQRSFNWRQMMLPRNWGMLRLAVSAAKHWLRPLLGNTTARAGGDIELGRSLRPHGCGHRPVATKLMVQL